MEYDLYSGPIRLDLRTEPLVRKSFMINYSGKIILPESVVNYLAMREEISATLFLRVHTEENELFAGVHEFSAREGTVQLPRWMFEALHIKRGAHVGIEEVYLVKGKFVLLQPHSSQFLEIKDHKASLESALKSFPVLNRNLDIDTCIEGRIMRFSVKGVEPDRRAVDVVDVDLEVDFLTPLDYKEPDVDHQSESLERWERYVKNEGGAPHELYFDR